MCLVTKKSEPMVAEDDIVCIKMLLLKDGRHVTPYRHADVTGAVEGDGVVNAEGERTIMRHTLKGSGWNEFSVEGGFIHTYLTSGIGLCKVLDNMEDKISVLGCKDIWENRFFSAVIPKGTEYFVDNERACAASASIVLGSDITEDLRGMEKVFDRRVTPDKYLADSRCCTLMKSPEAHREARKAWREWKNGSMRKVSVKTVKKYVPYNEEDEA